MVHGLDKIPKDKPVLFLPNHQNALIDVLLIGIKCNRTPYFLARSDVFKISMLRRFFTYLKMIPVYRVRDGRDTVTRNHEIFDACAQLLKKNEAITMFPEANHNLKRRVRPLSKGFTRVLFKALEDRPELDIQIVPVGLNYKHAVRFPDEAAVYYGDPIAVKELYDADDLITSAFNIRNTVETSLKQLTTHVEPESNYDEIIGYLKAMHTDFLDPITANMLVKNWNPTSKPPFEHIKRLHTGVYTFFYPFFLIINLPVILVWKFIFKRKVREAEFMGTFRFATAFIGLLCYLSVLFALFCIALNVVWALGIVGFIVVFNWWHIKSSKVL